IEHLTGRYLRIQFCLYRPCAHRDLHSFPTRRSSDLALLGLLRGATDAVAHSGPARAMAGSIARGDLDTVKRHVQALQRLDPEIRSEEHTSELQSLRHLVCRLLLEKKKPTPQPYQRPR